MDLVLKRFFSELCLEDHYIYDRSINYLCDLLTRRNDQCLMISCASLLQFNFIKLQLKLKTIYSINSRSLRSPPVVVDLSLSLYVCVKKFHHFRFSWLEYIYTICAIEYIYQIDSLIETNISDRSQNDWLLEDRWTVKQHNTIHTDV